MTFERILSLMKANQDGTDWGHTEVDNIWISFCLADVNLRFESRIAWEEKKPSMNFRLIYAATPILTFSLPVAESGPFGDTFKIGLAKATERMSLTKAWSRPYFVADY
jgi:hypothetical protein